MPDSALVDVDGEVGALPRPHPADLQLLLVVLVHLSFDDDTEILLWVLLPDPRQDGEVDVYPTPGICPQLDRVGLYLVHGRLARLLVHGHVVHLDDGSRLGHGGRRGQMDAQLRLR